LFYDEPEHYEDLEIAEIMDEKDFEPIDSPSKIK
jgi:hypothetical protein